MQHSLMGQLGQIRLQPLNETDAQRLRILRNAAKQYFFSRAEVSEQQQQQWYEAYTQKPGDYMFSVTTENAPTEFIGALGIYDVNQTDKSAEIGRIVIDKMKAPQSGIGTAAIVCAAQIAFCEMSLKTLRAEIYAENIRSRRAFEHAGFKQIHECADRITYQLDYAFFDTSRRN